MRLLKLRVENFRNYSRSEVEFNKNVNLFLGNNGQGKTNLLEAIHYALTGQPIRFVRPEGLINENSALESFSAVALVNIQGVENEVKAQYSGGKKRHLIGEKSLSSSSFKNAVNLVLFTPDTLNIIKGGSSERRHFIDEIWCSFDSNAKRLIRDYNQCLRSRNKLLKDAAEGRLKPTETDDLLSSINASFLNLATQVISGRISTIKSVLPMVKNVAKTFFKDTSVDISVDYVISKKSAIDWAKNQVYDALKLRLDELRKAEIFSGQSLVGPQKNDIVFYLNSHDARFFCSQGQQRAIALAFKIAQIQLFQQLKGYYPLLLLDDVFSELDEERREQLLEVLLNVSAQIFLTSTDLSTKKLFARKELKVFMIDNGNVNG